MDQAQQPNNLQQTVTEIESILSQFDQQKNQMPQFEITAKPYTWLVDTLRYQIVSLKSQIATLQVNEERIKELENQEIALKETEKQLREALEQLEEQSQLASGVNQDVTDLSAEIQRLKNQINENEARQNQIDQEQAQSASNFNAQTSQQMETMMRRVREALQAQLNDLKAQINAVTTSFVNDFESVSAIFDTTDRYYKDFLLEDMTTKIGNIGCQGDMTRNYVNNYYNSTLVTLKDQIEAIDSLILYYNIPNDSDEIDRQNVVARLNNVLIAMKSTYAKQMNVLNTDIGSIYENACNSIPDPGRRITRSDTIQQRNRFTTSTPSTQITQPDQSGYMETN